MGFPFGFPLGEDQEEGTRRIRNFFDTLIEKFLGRFDGKRGPCENREEVAYAVAACLARFAACVSRLRRRESSRLGKSPREEEEEEEESSVSPTMDPLYCYAVAARMPPSRPLLQLALYTDPMRVHTRFLFFFLLRRFPLSSVRKRDPSLPLSFARRVLEGCRVSILSRRVVNRKSVGVGRVGGWIGDEKEKNTSSRFDHS